MLYEVFSLLECWQGNRETVPVVSKEYLTFILSVMQSEKSLFLDRLNYLAPHILRNAMDCILNDIAQKFQKVLFLNSTVLKPETSRSLFKISSFPSCKNL